MQSSSSSRVVTPFSYITLLVPVIGLLIALGVRNVLIMNYVHVITGGTWTGIDLFMGLIMTRIMRGLPPDARVEVIKRLVPLMLFLMPSLSAVAITSGIYLAEWEGIFDLQAPSIILAGIFVIVLSVQGFGFIMPNEARIYLELRKNKPDIQKVTRLGMRNIRLAGSQAIFQIATIYVMANLAFGLKTIFPFSL